VDGFITYANVPDPVGCVVGSRLATYHELATVYGLEDMYDLLEIVQVDARNQQIADEAAAAKG
jgi:4-diphosphocytidyl-2C-methyl-D-erythritol kinase